MFYFYFVYLFSSFECIKQNKKSIETKNLIRDELGLDNIDIRFNWSPNNMTVLFNSLINLIEVNKSNCILFYFILFLLNCLIILYCIF